MSSNLESFNLKTIGVIHSPFKEKFSIPRQPGLIKHATMELELLAPYNHPDTLRDIEQYTHLWLLFIFHEHLARSWSPLVRPPRLGGNKKMGVFATRSSFRPNPVGMSVVELLSVNTSANKSSLTLAAGDLVDKTPVIDIKPYVPYSDRLDRAFGGIAHEAPEHSITVIFSNDALRQLNIFENEYPHLKLFIREVLSQDPRPAYKKNGIDEKTYGIKLYDFEIKWQVVNNECNVISIELD